MGSNRELTRRDALRAGGTAAMVVGASVAGCDARSPAAQRAGADGARTLSGSVGVFPVPGTPAASSRTTISFRGAGTRKSGKVTVTGSRTGRHSGKLRQHPDGSGVSFVSAESFEPGETVTVRTGMDVRGADDGVFEFQIARPFEASQSGSAKEDRAGDEEQDRAPRVRKFSSRPDLRPPQLDVVQPAAEAVSAGYVFVAPKKPREDTTQEGPLIVDNRGEVVWFHPLAEGTDAMDFKVQTFRGAQVLTWWEGSVDTGYGGGEYVVLDDSYQEIARVAGGNGYDGDLHEFRVTSEGTAVFTIYSAVDWTEPGAGSSKPVLDAVFQEVDMESGDVLFEWHSLGNVALDESYGDVIGDPADVFDYVHHNSIDVDSDGNFLLSGRHTRTVYKIDRATGDVIWRLGGKKSDFTMGKGTEFAYQHDAQRRSDGTVTVFDNAAGSKKSAVRDASRAVVLELDTEAMSATLAREYEPPENILSESQGNMQVLPDGNVFIGWGSAPAFTEYDRDGSVLFDARFPSEVESYRAFRFPWKGRPASKPAAAVGAGGAGGGALTVAASWNGATEVAAWEVLAGPAPGRLKPAGRQGRDGFETRIDVPSDAAHVAVRALDGAGKTLGTSEAVATGR